MEMWEYLYILVYLCTNINRINKLCFYYFAESMYLNVTFEICALFLNTVVKIKGLHISYCIIEYKLHNISLISNCCQQRNQSIGKNLPYFICSTYFHVL